MAGPAQVECERCRRTYPVALHKACPHDGGALLTSRTDTPTQATPLVEIRAAEGEPTPQPRLVPLGEEEPDAADDPPLPHAPELEVGSVVGQFQIEQKIGEGGGGTVYAARHTSLDRRAAIKVLHPALLSDANAVQRFIAEARTVNAVQHPAVVDVFDVGRLGDGRPYLIMELLEGETLKARLRGPDLPVGVKVDLSLQLVDVLLAAHSKGIVHRDLKPENVFLLAGAPPRVKLLDFGIAKLVSDSAGVGPERTRTGFVVGTPAFMAPEQIRGQGVVPASDVYSLGVLLYRLFAGRHPFVRPMQTAADLFVAHLTQAPADPLSVSPKIPLALARLILQMLAKTPAERPSLLTVREVLKPRVGASAVVLPAAPQPAPRPSAPVSPIPIVPVDVAPSRAPIVAAIAVTVLVVGAALRKAFTQGSTTAVPIAAAAPSGETVATAVPTGETVAVAADQTPRPAVPSVRLSFAPRHATVLLNGVKVSTGSGFCSLDLIGGVGRIRVEATGFVPFERELRLAPGQGEILDVSLTSAKTELKEPTEPPRPRRPSVAVPGTEPTQAAPATAVGEPTAPAKLPAPHGGADIIDPFAQ